jgi:hypothetical protein
MPPTEFAKASKVHMDFVESPQVRNSHFSLVGKLCPEMWDGNDMEMIEQP